MATRSVPFEAYLGLGSVQSVPRRESRGDDEDLIARVADDIHKTNTLGLTPGDESDENDKNEEERLNEMVGADAPK